MLKLTNFLTRPIAAAAAIALLGLTLGSAQAAIIQTDTLDESSQVAFTGSATDLINQGQSTFSSQTTTPAALDFGSSGANLNEGTMGTSGDLATAAAHHDAVWSATFNLDVSTNTLGYDITGVTTYAGWEGVGNSDQSYELFVSVVGDASFSSLGSFSFDVSPAGDASTRIVLTDGTGTIAAGVDALRFDFPSLSGALTGVYREIDAFGSATVIPEPSSMALFALGLVGMVSLRKRNRC